MNQVTATAVPVLSFRDLTEKQQAQPLYDWLKSLAEPLRLRVKRAEDFTGIIPAKYGDIYAHSPTALAWCAVGIPSPRKRSGILKRADFPYEVLQWGDSEFTIVFAPQYLDAVATLAGCRRKQLLSDEDRQRRAGRMRALRQSQISSGNLGGSWAKEGPSNDQGAVPTTHPITKNRFRAD